MGRLKYSYCFIIVLGIIVNICGVKSAYESFDYKITNLDNPAPGYLKFTWGLKPEFFLIDNSGYQVHRTTTLGSTSQFYHLKNGNWAQKSNDSYIIYDKDLIFIDSVPNPTINRPIDYIIDMHDFKLLSNGHYLMLLNKFVPTDMSKYVEGGNPNATLISSVLIETDFDGIIYWEWESVEHLSILDVTEDVDLTQKSIDLAHINSMFEDSDGNIIVSIRHYDEISKINKSTGEFIWRFGGSSCKNNEFEILNDDQNGFKGFSHQHSASILENGNILLFDNGNVKPSQISRAVEYKMDFANKKATKVWEAHHNPEIYLPAMGSAYRLENGNTLINWAKAGIVEVRKDNSIAYQLNFSQSSMGVYTASRIIAKMDAVTRFIKYIGDFSYNDSKYKTGVNLKINSFIDSGYASIEKHYYEPHNLAFADTTFTSILPYRWVFNASGIKDISGIFQLNVDSLKNKNPNKLSIYKRAQEGEGIFEELPNFFNSSTNEIRAAFSGTGEFVICSCVLLKPELLKPENSSITQISEKFQWAKLSGANTYQFQLDTSISFNKPVRNLTLNNVFELNLDSLLNNTNYYWRIRGMNNKDTSVWSSIFSFSTVIGSLKLSYPPTNSIGIELSDTLKWNKVSEVEFYRIQLSKDSEFNELDVNEVTFSNEFSNITSLNIFTKYYWRVKAVRKTDSSDFSQIWNFRTRSTESIETPLLLEPVNGKSAVPVISELSWSLVKDAEKYNVSISETPNFDLANTKSFSISSNKIDYSDLKYNSTYYWRVSAISKNTTSGWSETFRFLTELTPPVIINPSDNSTEVPLEGDIIWNTEEQNSSNLLQISTDENFNTLIVDLKLIDKNIFSYELEGNLQYYLRIKSLNDSNQSQWSKVIKFKTKDPNNIKDAKEEIISVYPNPIRNTTNFNFSLNESGLVVITIYDIFGKEISEIYSSLLNPGEYKIHWDARSFNSGIYYYQFSDGRSSVINKLLIIK